jgi:hypothetical protein
MDFGPLGIKQVVDEQPYNLQQQPQRMEEDLHMKQKIFFVEYP